MILSILFFSNQFSICAKDSFLVKSYPFCLFMPFLTKLKTIWLIKGQSENLNKMQGSMPMSCRVRAENALTIDQERQETLQLDADFVLERRIDKWIHLLIDTEYVSSLKEFYGLQYDEALQRFCKTRFTIKYDNFSTVEEYKDYFKDITEENFFHDIEAVIKRRAAIKDILEKRDCSLELKSRLEIQRSRFESALGYAHRGVKDYRKGSVGRLEELLPSEIFST